MPTLVVAALSARLLAQSARRAGWNVLALDLFGDVDTCAAATWWERIGDPAVMRIDRGMFIEALEAARDEGDCIGWIAGSGFESEPDLLHEGARLLPLIGNDPATAERVRDPPTFFAALKQLGIVHPETRFEAPRYGQGWLTKDLAASGGRHIRRTPFERRRAVRIGTYFQLETRGRPMSLLFVAAGGRALPIGFNELLVRERGMQPYIYHGAIGPVVDMPSAAAAQVSNALAALMQVFPLRGLGSLDFLLIGEACSVLELNPRPTATIGLYDAGFESGLLKVHIDACGATPPNELVCPAADTLRGELVVYTTKNVPVTGKQVEGLVALGCHDVPLPQSHVPAGVPLCSVSAQGANVEEVRAALVELETRVRAIVQNRGKSP